MLRTTAAIAAGKLTRAVAKRRGGGSALPGEHLVDVAVIELDPELTCADCHNGGIQK